MIGSWLSKIARAENEEMVGLSVLPVRKRGNPPFDQLGKNLWGDFELMVSPIKFDENSVFHTVISTRIISI